MRVLLIGQGISGTWLSYWLHKMGANILVVDKQQANAASRVASGVINPVTGRQVSTTWMANELLPFAAEQYAVIESLLGMSVFHDCGILSFPPSGQMLDAYEKKMLDVPQYIQSVSKPETFKTLFNFPLGVVKIAPAYLIHLAALLDGWSAFLKQKQAFLEASFDSTQLEKKADKLIYRGFEADVMIRCDGPRCFQDPLWSGLPFSFNKGEALILDIPDLPPNQIYKFGITTLVPWKDGFWWAGSTYDNRYTDENPTEAFRLKMQAFLEITLKIPYQVIDHMAGIRPATIDRRPMVGIHPNDPAQGIFNGMGTKGVSLAPYFGKQFAEHLLNGTLLDPFVDISRFKRAFL